MGYKNHKEFLKKRDTAHPSWDRLNVFIKKYQQHKDERNKKLRVLDIGCGNYAYLHKFIQKDDEYYGCDYYKALKIKIKNYKQVDLNEESLSKKYNQKKFDVIFCGEVIEHVFSPDDLLDEIKKLMHKDSILILSTPNLGYYVNRILLLFGIAPLFLENASEYKLGRKFKFLGQMHNTEGHISIFTYGALKDLFKIKKMKIISTTPVIIWKFWPDKIIGKLFKSLAPDNVFVLEK